MPARITARSVQRSLEERLSQNSLVLKDAGNLLAFSVAASSGDPMSTAAGLGLILKTSGSLISIATGLLSRFGSVRSKSKAIREYPGYERFQVLFYVASQRAYMQALRSKLKPDSLTEPQGSPKRPPKEQLKSLKKKLTGALGNLSEAEIDYLYCIEPLEGGSPLFTAFGMWLAAALEYYGYSAAKIRLVVHAIEKDARKRFRVFLASHGSTAAWMRNYLALQEAEVSRTKVVEDLAAIRETLEGWTESVELGKREREAWDEYRKELQHLPDQKETMFGERFGVRKVFVQPEVKYHIAGATGNAGKPTSVKNLDRLFGALLSNRSPGDDLIILCGGPGSGKSTLCRVLASELAQNESIHPVFLRLRRLKEGSDVSVFLEESLQRLGVIDRISDLRHVPNLVVLLDGFDELVMASRARIRQFFGALRDEHSTGPLRAAKFVVSGRDTLFPKGEGLPAGSQVLSLEAFDAARVKKWGARWRRIHRSGPGHGFRPETLLEGASGRRGARRAPLHHLVSWPLTLHLVARVHTAGKLDVAGKARSEVEKAYLYRSILAETALRQQEQAPGEGRLDSRQIRQFLRDLAWAMYTESRDSMDPTEVIPLLRRFYDNAGDAEMAELAEVAVVNSPELAKGEETGFEFVHKSFSEYLVAESIAEQVERTAFKSEDFGSDRLTWRMSDEEATASLAPALGIRLLTAEVQEMLEPMIGSLLPFLHGESVGQRVPGAKRRDGLERVLERFGSLIEQVSNGRSLGIVTEKVRARSTDLLKSPLEAYANFLAGLFIIGSAAARELGTLEKKESRLLLVNRFQGSFWRSIAVMQAGGLDLDRGLAERLFDGASVAGESEEKVSDLASPLRLGFFSVLDGFEQHLTEAAIFTLEEFVTLQLVSALQSVMPIGPREFPKEYRGYRRRWLDLYDDGSLPVIHALQESGFLSPIDPRSGRGLLELHSYLSYELDSIFSPKRGDRKAIGRRLRTLGDEYRHRSRSPAGEYLGRLIHDLGRVFERENSRGLRAIAESLQASGEFVDYAFRGPWGRTALYRGTRKVARPRRG